MTFASRILCSMLGALALVAVASGQEKLTNAKIIQMIQAGFDEETIVAAVQSKPTDFDTSIDALIELKSAGVSEPVLRAVMDSDEGRPIHPGVPTKTSFPTEIGVYVRDETVFKDVLPEIITWKTGGVMKSLATGGLTKGHTNGVLEGPISRLQTS